MSRPWKRALLWLAFLAPFFFATYGLANWIASRRSDVGAIVYAWERDIPFLAWTIVPYWSIDVLYGASLFVCVSRRELDTHAKRLLCAQIVCVAVFLLFPLRFDFERPPTEGLFGALFDLLMGFDKPFNQMPSLHIALLVIIWLRFLHHTVGAWRWLVHAWAALIAVSVLTTYQHHFIDIPTGLWAGWLCVWLFPDDGRFPAFDPGALRDRARRNLAVLYGAGAVALGALGLLAGGWGLWLSWAAGALALVAVIYAALDERAFQKSDDGSLSAAAWWLLGPYLAAAWINSRWWTRGLRTADAVVPGLYLGRVPAGSKRERYAAVVDLSAELPCRTARSHYACVPQLDLTVASPGHIGRAVDAIEQARAQAGGPVLVCCALGFSRSAVAVAAWLIASGHAPNAAEAVAMIRRARSSIVLRGAHLAALESFALECRRAAA